MEHTKTKGCLDSLTLKLLAMALMLCDHLWATVLPGVMWLTAVGRIAFPIFAFRIGRERILGFSNTYRIMTNTHFFNQFNLVTGQCTISHDTCTI